MSSDRNKEVGWEKQRLVRMRLTRATKGESASQLATGGYPNLWSLQIAGAHVLRSEQGGRLGETTAGPNEAHSGDEGGVSEPTRYRRLPKPVVAANRGRACPQIGTRRSVGRNNGWSE